MAWQGGRGPGYPAAFLIGAPKLVKSPEYFKKFDTESIIRQTCLVIRSLGG